MKMQRPNGRTILTWIGLVCWACPGSTAGISSDIQPAQYLTVSSTGQPGSQQLGHVIPPTVTLTRTVDGSTTQLWAWHQLALTGAAGKPCTLMIQDATGNTLLTFVMQNAWPSKMDFTGMRAGTSTILMETDQFVCDSITMQ